MGQVARLVVVLIFGFVLLGAGGCALTHRKRGEPVSIGDGGLDPDEHPPDGAVDRMDADVPPPSMDSGMLSDAGMMALDSGPANDASKDADVPLDASADAGADAAFDPMLCIDLPDPSNIAQLGTPLAPVEHAAAAAPFSGVVDERGRAFVRLTGVTPGQRYSVRVEGEALELTTFDQDAFGYQTCVSGPVLAPDVSYCIVSATDDTLDVAIRSSSGTKDFVLVIAAVGSAIGTPQAPQPVALADLPQELDVSPHMPSFFKITGVTEGTRYVVIGRVPSGDPVQLAIYESPAFDVIGQLQRTPNGAVSQPAVEALYVALAGSVIGEAVTLSVVPVSHASEGTLAAPVSVAATELPYEGEIGWGYNVFPTPPPGTQTGESFYVITGLAPGDHVVSLHAPPSTGLIVYGDDATYTALSRCAVYVANDMTGACSTRILGTSIYVQVMNSGGSGAPVTLDVESPPYRSEGSSNEPLPLVVSDLPYEGEAQAVLPSHYTVSDMAVGAPYLARVSGLTSTGTLYVDGGDASGHSCESPIENGAASCGFSPDSESVEVTVVLNSYPRNGVSNGRNVGDGYTLELLQLDGGPVGTPEAPVSFECTVSPYESTLSPYGSSYYRVTGLSPGQLYYVEVTSPQYVELQVAAGPIEDYSEIFCVESGGLGDPAGCLAVAVNGALFVRATGTALGDSLQLAVRRPYGGSEGEKGAPHPIAELPFYGHVGTARSSYYAVSGLVPGASYTVQAASAHNSLLATAYSDPDFENAVGGSVIVAPGAPAQLSFTASSSTMYFELTTLAPADSISDIRIDLVE